MKSHLSHVVGAVFVALLLAACGGGGGGGDAERTSVIEGNVSSASSTRARGSVAGLQVAVRGTDATTETDGNGFFRLEGGFAGPVMVDFTAPGLGSAAMGVDVAEGETVVLQDVAVDLDNGEAVPGEVVVTDDDRNPPFDELDLEDDTADQSPAIEDTQSPADDAAVTPVPAATTAPSAGGGFSGVPTVVTPSGTGTGATVVTGGTTVGGTGTTTPGGTGTVVTGGTDTTGTAGAGIGTGTQIPGTDVVIGESSIAGPDGEFINTPNDTGGLSPTLPGGGDADPFPPQGPGQVDVLDEVPGDNDDEQPPASVGSGAGFDSAASGNETGAATIGGGGFGFAQP